MANNQYNNAQPRPKTILNHRSLTMYAPNGEGKFASLAIDFKKNDPTITVYTNIPGDQDNGRLQAQIPLDKFYAVLSMIEAAANSKTPFRWGYEHKDRKFIGQGKMTEGPVLHWRVIVGREESGIVYISIVMDKRPNIKFSFLNDTKTFFKDGDGNEMPKDLESKFLALGRVNAWRNYLSLVLKEQYVHPEPRQQNGGGNNYQRNNGNGGGNYGGGNSSGGNNGGGSNKNTSMEEEDMPW